MSIILILLIINIPLLKVIKIYDNLRLVHTTNMLVSDLKYCKILAYSKGYDVNFYFLRDNNSKDFEGYMIVQGTNTIKKVQLPNNVLISRSLSTFTEDNKLTFNPNGSVSPYACSIVLIDKNSRKEKTITLTIGFTRIMEK